MAIGKQSVGSTGNLFQGYWSHVEFWQNPPNTADPAHVPNRQYLGVIQEGVLEISREDTEYMGTNFPRTVELLTPSQMGMKFSGQMDELHEENLHVAIGDTANNENNYIIPAAGCSLDASFGNLVIKRARCADSFIMEAVIWKTTGSGALSLGGADTVVGTPVEFNAVDDSNGDFHDTANAQWGSAPLGFIYAPDPVAGSTDPT